MPHKQGGVGVGGMAGFLPCRQIGHELDSSSSRGSTRAAGPPLTSREPPTRKARPGAALVGRHRHGRTRLWGRAASFYAPTPATVKAGAVSGPVDDVAGTSF